MNKKALWNFETAKWSGIYALLFMMLAHAYRFFTLGYTNDSIEIVQSTDILWKIQLGRVLQPVYWLFRGDIVAPYLIGVLTVLWLAASVYLLARLMDLQSRLSIALICMMLSANATMSLTNATFIHETDTYMLAMLLSTTAVYFWDRSRNIVGVLTSAVLICASLAIYQSYFQVTILLCLMVLAKRSLEGERVCFVIKSGIYALVAFVLGLVFYEIGMRLVTQILEIERATTYNGIGNVGDYSVTQIPELLFATYMYPLKYFSKVEAHNPRVTGAIYYGLIALTAISMVALVLRRRLDKKNTVLAIGIFLLMPLGMNAVYFISKGLMHSLMIYSYFVFFVFSVSLMEYLYRETGQVRLCAIVTIMISLVFFNNTVYANQFYIRRDLEFQSTLSLMTRIIDRAEQVDGYIPGNTPVAIIGTMYNSPLAMERPGFEHLAGNDRTMHNNYYATTAEVFYPWYFWQVLGYPFNLVSEYERIQIASEPDVRAMPVFPAEGCCQMRGGILVVKVGNVKQ